MGGIFMRNYTDGEGIADNIVEIQRIRPSKKDYPWNRSDRQGVGIDEA
jgi:hypothetical protein